MDKRQNAVEAKKRLGKYFERKSSGNKGDANNKNGKQDPNESGNTDKTT